MDATTKSWDGPDYLAMLDALLLADHKEEEENTVTQEAVETVTEQVIQPQPVQQVIQQVPTQPVVMNGTLGMDDELKNHIAGLKKGLGNLENMDDSLDSMRHTIDERLNVNFDAMYDNVIDQMNVESVKEYRNIQAVIVEENAKQNRVLIGIDEKTSKLKTRMNHVMIFSIVSFVVSILVMIITILPAFGVKLF